MSNLQWKLFITFIFLFTVACNQPSQVKSNLATADAVSAAGIYPHTEEFKTKTHGSEFMQNRELCAKCHGKDYNGGNTKVSCQKCHGPNFPHPHAWALPQNHGVYFAGIDDDKLKEVCLKCHTGDKNSAVGVACTQCHKAYPHFDDDHSETAKTYEGQCTACHRDFTANMPNLGSCTKCHRGRTLEIHWLKPPAPTPTPTPVPTAQPTQSKASVKKVKRIPSSKK